MRDESFAWDPADATSICREHNLRVAESDPRCANCGHTKSDHWDRYGCQIEGSDQWVDGESMGAWVAPGPCGCMDFQAAESDMERDVRVSGPTFAEGQARLARALEMLRVSAVN